MLYNGSTNIFVAARQNRDSQDCLNAIGLAANLRIYFDANFSRQFYENILMLTKILSSYGFLWRAANL